MNILTFDIEEWFHCDMGSDVPGWDKYETRIDQGTDRILALLATMNLKATFFCLGWLASRHPEVIRKIHGAGHEIGCHSYLHEPAFRLNRIQFKSDTEKSIKSIEDIIGKKVKLYRAPAFSFTDSNIWAFEVIAELGIEIDCSILPARHDYGGFPSFDSFQPSLIKVKGYTIKEFPINITKLFSRIVVFSGGGFFRIMPYFLISSLMNKSDYVMTYFHARDFDKDQPRITSLSLQRRFKSYVGINRAYKKFERLLKDFDFVSVLQADEMIDWKRVRSIQLQ